MADNRTNPTVDPSKPSSPKDGPGKQGNLGEQGSETFAGDQDDRERRQTAEQQGEVPRPGTEQGPRRDHESDPAHRVERGTAT